MTRWLDRRELLRNMCVTAAALPLAKLAMGCGDNSSNGDDSQGDDAPGPDSGGDSDWASGGTVAMTDKASYPDPFTSAIGSCVVVQSSTEGPCNTPSDLDRQDISEGRPGVPVRLALKVVDASCAPVVGAVVKVWSTDRTGVYSGATPNPSFCSNGDAVAIAANWGRGVQTTNPAGVVYFDTCFPGWYPGRAIHIHFQVKTGNTTYRISQLFFPEDVTTGIFAGHVDYEEFGQPNTTFANDGVIAPITGEARNRLILDIAKMTDRAMLASKVISVM